MNKKRVLLIFSIIGVLFLIFLSQTTTQSYKGTIESIESSNNKIIITIENSTTELILFETSSIALKKGNIIEFQGRKDTYKNKKQIIVDKITLSQDKNK